MDYKEIYAEAHEIAEEFEKKGYTVQTAKMILDGARQEIERNSVVRAEKEEPPTAATEGGEESETKIKGITVDLTN